MTPLNTLKMRTKLLFAFTLLLLISCTPTFIVTFSGGQGGVVSDAGGEYDEGTVVSVTAIPDAEYEFVSWSNGSTQNPISVTVSETTSYTASFKKVEYEVTTNIIGQGTIKEEVLIQGGRYTSGTKLRLTAIPQEGWEFDTWSGSVISTLNPIELDVNAAKDIVANFSKLNPLYLDENGVTIKAYDYAEVGDVWGFEGDEYTIVDEQLLRKMVEENKDVSKVVTSKVTNMKSLFYNNSTFNQDISNWDVSNVVDMSFVFSFAREFNQDISLWNVANVRNMNAMFQGTYMFNQPIGSWDVSNVETMATMFNDARVFNQPLGNWDVSKVEDMYSMFSNAKKFNQPLEDWDVSKVEDMKGMFAGLDDFDQTLNNWNVSNVKDMTNMFFGAESFNQYIGDWDTSEVILMDNLFFGAISFNQSLENWDTSKVMSMQFMFWGAEEFNKPIGNWDVSSVTDMRNMFQNTVKFNQPIKNWDVSKVSNMNYMFYNATGFNQDISNWCVTSIKTEPDGFVSNGELMNVGISALIEEYFPIWGQCGEIYLSENSVTIKARDSAIIGRKYKIRNEGEEYLVVNREMLDQMLKNGEDVSKVITTYITSFNFLFLNMLDFNQDIGSWDTSNVTNMNRVFSTQFARDSIIFNKDIGSWDTSNVITMSGMFQDAKEFNQDISRWDVSNVQNMEFMFARATSFNQDLASWDVNNVTQCSYFMWQATNNWILPKPNFTNCTE